MRLSLRFHLGPLVAWFPLAGGRRRGRAQSGGSGGGCLVLVVRLAVWLTVLSVCWPYLAARAVGPSLGWPERRATGVGVLATLAWVVVALVVNAATN